tara:strand:- start:1080 stop:1793 length:714 start_codon:yes stop_codon:yes gene_type:complete
MMGRFEELFNVEKPIIGMIHLAGEDSKDILRRALEELAIYEEEGVNGAIIEDYHGELDDVHRILKESQGKFPNLKIGINTLINPYASLSLANHFGAEFVQFDSVQTPDLDLERYNKLREEYPDIVILGGVGFKYKQPTGNPLEVDLQKAQERCDAIVTTGSGTGVETPIEKLIDYRTALGCFPLVVGAGVTLDNIVRQLHYTDGAIIGSCFKPDGNTELPVDRNKVRSLMDIVKDIR